MKYNVTMDNFEEKLPHVVLFKASRPSFFYFSLRKIMSRNVFVTGLN